MAWHGMIDNFIYCQVFAELILIGHLCLKRMKHQTSFQLGTDKGVGDLHEFIPAIGGTTLSFRRHLFY